MNSSIFSAFVNRCKTATRPVRAFLKSTASSLFSPNAAVRSEDVVQYPMKKVIWMLWNQGWHKAPWVVQKCLASWQLHNPDWEIRAVDSNSVQRYIELPDLEGKEVIPAHMSDIVRSLLLHEYGGVWCDATLVCHRPLDSWLPSVMSEGFFAFDRPAPDRVLATWFIATKEGHLLTERLHSAVQQFWKDRERPGAYFWMHYLFGELCESDPQFGSAWNKVPKISADGPHLPQWKGLLEESESVVEQALLSLAPVSKLTYRFDPDSLSKKALLSRMLADLPDAVLLPSMQVSDDASSVTKSLTSLRVSSQNLGDYIQLLASQRLIERVFAPSELFMDLDEIRSWPGPDLILSLPRRAYAPEQQQQVFVVSKDQEILSILPPSLSDSSFINHYVSGVDFEENMQAAAALLETYASRARLIVTTLLDCALPAIAMGIPVVMFYPKNIEAEHASELERFASLAKIIPIYRFEDAIQVDWEPKQVSVAAERLRIADSFYQLAETWQLPLRNRYPRLAPTSVCPPPGGADYSLAPESAATT